MLRATTKKKKKDKRSRRKQRNNKSKALLRKKQIRSFARFQYFYLMSLFKLSGSSFKKPYAKHIPIYNNLIKSGKSTLAKNISGKFNLGIKSQFNKLPLLVTAQNFFSKTMPLSLLSAKKNRRVLKIVALLPDSQGFRQFLIKIPKLARLRRPKSVVPGMIEHFTNFCEYNTGHLSNYYASTYKTVLENYGRYRRRR